MASAVPDPYVELLDEGRGAEVARRRRRRRWLEQQAVESATWEGVLLDLAESAATVLVTTRSGRAHRGSLIGVGEDVAVLAVAGGGRLLVARPAVAAVRASGALAARPAGDRTVGGARLVDLLGEIAGPREGSVTLWMGAVGPVRGVLSAVGTDVVAVLQPDLVTYVPVDAITEAVVGPEL